jgi:hypothetical protein
MGTRSTVKFYQDQQIVASIYQQYDGYISGVGYDLAKWLKTKTVVNGFSAETMEAGFANGMGCLAAQYVRENKVKIGGFYMTTVDDEQEYNYEVRLVDDGFEITVEGFKGSPDELLNYVEPENKLDSY